MRIISGKYRGHPLNTPKTRDTRPTTDRTREAIFNVLSHADFCQPIENTIVLDIFSGTGALGLETMSRGADSAIFVEKHRPALTALKQNITTLQLDDMCIVIKGDATRLKDRTDNVPPATLVFLDPPYDQGLGIQALERLSKGNWLAPGATIVFEMSAKTPEEIPEGFTLHDSRDYGDTRVLFLSYESRSAKEHPE